MGLYTDNANTPGTQLCTSATIVNPTAAIQTYTVTGGPTVVSGTDYWIAFTTTAIASINEVSGSVSLGCTGLSSSLPATATYGAITTSTTFWGQMNVTTFVVSSNTLATNNPDYSQSANQIQQYTADAPIPSGSFSIISVVQHGLVTLGPSGPQHIDFSVRTGGSDFFSSDLAPGTAWTLLTTNWDTNPNTTVSWLTTDLASASTSFNMGYKSKT